MEIREIEASQTWPLRHRAMYPEHPADFVKLANDIDGSHFGAYIDEQLVSVVSVFQQGDDFQFRKFATEPAAQGKGIGSALLEFIVRYAQTHGAARLWCNARENALRFYSRFGFSETDTRYEADGYTFVIIEKRFGE